LVGSESMLTDQTTIFLKCRQLVSSDTESDNLSRYPNIIFIPLQNFLQVFKSSFGVNDLGVSHADFEICEEKSVTC